MFGIDVRDPTGEKHPLSLAARWAAVLLPVTFAVSSRMTDVTASFIVVVFLIYTVVHRKYGWLREPWIGALLALWLFTIVRTAFAEDPGEGLPTAIVWGRFIILAAALGTWLLVETEWRNRFIWCLIAVAGFLAVDCLIQFATGYDIIGHPTYGNDSELGRRLTASIGRPYVGLIIAWTFLPAVLALYAWGYRLGSATLGLACVTAVLLSGERMAFVLVVAALALAAPLLRIKKRVIMAGAAVLLVGLIGLLAVRPEIYSRQIGSTINGIRYVGETAYGVIWKRAARIVSEHPVTGIGVGQYRAECRKPIYGPYDPSKIETRFFCEGHPHQVYLEWLVNAGAVGLGLFVLALGLFARRAWFYVRSDPADLVFAGAMVTLFLRLFPVVTSPGLMRAWAAVPLWMLIGFAFSYVTAKDRERN